MNLFTILETAADTFGDRTALRVGGRDLSYVELRRLAEGVSALAQRAGARAVVYLDVAGEAAPALLFGAAHAGLPYVPLNYRLTAAEQSALLARLPGAMLVAGAAYAAAGAPPGGSVLATEALLAAALDAGDAGQAGEDAVAVAVQLFTSGTTGAPKAALLRHANLCAYVFDTVEFAGAGEEEAALVCVPPYHIAGIAALLTGIWAGRRIVLLPEFSPEAWLTAARETAVTSAFLVPTMLQRIVAHLDATGAGPALPALRAIAYGGGRMPASTIARAVALFPDAGFTNAYGLTETSSTICLLGPEDHRGPAARLSSVGRPIPGVELEVRDAAGAAVPAGELGIVFVRGPQVAGEYEGLGSQLDAEGWFCTRDRGWLDQDGYLYLDGRADDVIVRGAENISPGEIEDVLMLHPAVADAAVVGIPDEQWGEGVAAAVVVRPGQSVEVSALQDWVRARLRSSRVPQRVVMRAALPSTDTGKVLRRVIRAELAAGDG